MTPGQRRTLWICTFGMCFIFFYEASGVALIRPEAIPDGLKGEALRNHFWQQASYGGAFLVLGALISILVETKPAKPDQAAFHWLDWVAVSIALGVLAGTLWRSYHAVPV